MSGEKQRQEIVDEGDDGGEAPFQLPDGLHKPPGVVAALYTFPESLHGIAGRGDIRVVMWELTPREERVAIKRAKGSELDAAYTMVHQAVRAVDDEVVDWGKEGAADNAIAKLMRDIGAKGRSLLMQAYLRQCSPSEEESESFFASVKTGV